MSLPRYAEYKPSGVAWLGQVPSSWGVRRLKSLFEIKKRIAGEEGHEVLSITQRGLKIKDIESNDGQLSMDYSKYQLVEPGDFAMNHMDLLTGYVDLSNISGVTSPDYRVFSLRSRDACCDRYFLYLFQNAYHRRIFYAFGQGASHLGRWRLPAEQFNNFFLPFPSLEEQTAIADFLDRETARSDDLIAHKERLITALDEERLSVIHEAVSGASSCDWPVIRLKYISVRIVDTEHKTAPFYPDGQYPVARTTNIRGGQLVWTDMKFTDDEGFRQWTSRGRPEPGDVLFTREAPAGEACIVPVDTSLCIGQRVVLLKLSQQRANPMFIVHSIYGGLAKDYIQNLSQGTTVAHFNMADIRNIPFRVPDLVVQEAACRRVDEACKKISALRQKCEDGIRAVREFHIALVSDAVTGQIDVRTYRPQEVVTLCQ